MSRSFRSRPIGRAAPRDRKQGADDVIEALERFHLRATRLGAHSLSVVATEPLRRAKDRSDVLKALRNKVGIEPVVLSHEEEGLLTVLGLIHPHDQSTPLLVGDIGGGSTEIVSLAQGSAQRRTDSQLDRHG